VKNFFSWDSYKVILAIAWPLILSTCSNTIQQFVDKIFLSQYSVESMAAAMPSGMLVMGIIGFFSGTLGYVSTFVAQYSGAKEKDKIAVFVMQGIILSVLFALISLLIIPYSKTIFVDIAKHSASIAKLEIDYFNTLTYFGFVPICFSAIGSFFIGIAKTKILLWVSIVITLLNVIFDYLLIFGKFGFPEMGIKGAAYATQFATFVGLIILFFIFFSNKYNKEYNTRHAWKINFPMLKRLLRYGAPSGIQMTLEVGIWTLFIFFIGRMSVVNLAATNIAFQINSIAFMPIFGVGTAVSILVANELGKTVKKELGVIIKSAMSLSVFYNLIVGAMFMAFPLIFIKPFIISSGANSQELMDITVVLLRLICAYLIIDGVGIILASVLRGAGDTLFVMATIVINGIIFVVLPGYYATKLNSLYFGWLGVITFVFVIGVIFAFRVKQGNWKKLCIIK